MCIVVHLFCRVNINMFFFANEHVPVNLVKLNKDLGVLFYGKERV